MELGEGMRTAMLSAVRALLGDPRLADRKDVVRLGAVVLLAKAAHRTCQVAITARELGRWLGVHESTVDHEVLPVLQETGLVTKTVVSERGRAPFTYYRIMPMWNARGVKQSPLALQRQQLATLLRFIESLFAPGWGQACETQPGLLAGRRGRGAATDRLALLLLALESRPDGRVPLMGGRLARKLQPHGRAAATLARLLGCAVPTAASVLARLERVGAVGPVGGDGKGLRLPAIASAHHRGSQPQVDAAGAAPTPAHPTHPATPSSAPSARTTVCDNCRGEGQDALMPLEGEGWRQPSFEDLLLEPTTVNATAPRGIGTTADGKSAAQRDPLDSSSGRKTTGLHTHHAPVADHVLETTGDFGFSGEADREQGSLPRRAYTREANPHHALPMTGAGSASSRACSPLRGDKPNDLPPTGSAHGEGADNETFQAWRRAYQTVVPVWSNVPAAVLSALQYAEILWGHLARPGARRRVEQAVKCELQVLRETFGANAKVEQILASRLRRRIDDQGDIPLRDPVGWLVGRGFRRRSVCPDMRCDDGMRMDTGYACEACQLLYADRRALRHAAVVELHHRLGTSVTGRVPRREFDTELHRTWKRQVQHQALQQRHEAKVHQARQAAVSARREELQAAEAARQQLPCGVCGRPHAGGLCGSCANARRVEELISDAKEIAVAAWAFQRSREQQRDVASTTESEIRAKIRQEREGVLAEGAFEETVSVMGRLTAELALGEIRRRALEHLACSEEASVEANTAGTAELRRRHLHGTRVHAKECAGAVSRLARWRTAEYLLRMRVGTLRASGSRTNEDRKRQPYARQAEPIKAVSR
ncbi:hypothetical protein ABZ478_32620 [Streptomyces sp. NPDC005706]|uniref:hypothetical protein n=1 Tax=Streptomyces sp. NPDC005706 TaxID=3157169 RepID=UPI0033E0F6A2